MYFLFRPNPKNDKARSKIQEENTKEKNMVQSADQWCISRLERCIICIAIPNLEYLQGMLLFYKKFLLNILNLPLYTFRQTHSGTYKQAIKQQKPLIVGMTMKLCR
jgi:hypothetical protein